MPVSYRLDGRIVVLSMEGRYQVEDLQASLLACFADPELPSDAVLLFDQRRSLGGHLKTGHSWTPENRPPRGGVRDCG